MPTKPEIPLLSRQFDGVVLALDPAFLTPQQTQRASNFVPDAQFILAKRRGSLPYQDVPLTTNLPAMLRAKGPLDRYLYLGRLATTGTDHVWVSVNDGPAGGVAGALFTTTGARIGLVRIGGVVYAGNGVDPLLRIPLGGIAVALTALATTDDTGQLATPTADTASGLLPGTYSYAWAVYDYGTRQWISRGVARQVQITGSWSRLAFTAPGGGLAANRFYRLFVSPVNQEIEGAHDQTPNGLAPGGTYQCVGVTATGPVIPMRPGVTRTGKYLRAHRGSLVGAGDVANPRQVWASNVLVGGPVEEALYAQGEYFPAHAQFDIGDDVTGIGVAGPTSAERQPRAALAAFALSQTWLYYGDLLDQSQAELAQLSGEIGCAAHATIVNTPAGLLFLGAEGVYLIPAGSLQEPIDVGWTIAPALRAIPAIARPFACATFHRGFYKLAIAEPGGVTNTVQWWLDMRRPFDGIPRWSGPHRHPAVTAFAKSREETAEPDRAWAAIAGGGAIVVLEQPNSYRDNGVDIVSDVLTRRHDTQTPFDPKLFKRIRVVTRTENATGLTVTIRTDETSSVSGTMPLAGSGGAQWNTGQWNTGRWGSARFVEGEFIAPPPEPRGRSFEVQLLHAEAVSLTLRDIEVRLGYKERGERGGA